MTDPLEILELPTTRLEPQAEYRVRLMKMLEVEVADRGPGSVPDRVGPQMIVAGITDERDAVDGGRRWQYLTMLVAAVAAVVVVATVAIVQHRDVGSLPASNQPSEPMVSNAGAESPAAALPRVSTTTTTTTTTTIPVDPVRDADLAQGMLLTASEYAPGWSVTEFKDLVLDRMPAAEVAGCAPFLDAVFESSGRPAVTAFRTFGSPLPAAMSQYVVVFQSEPAARAMFDATVDPRFHDECFEPYRDLVGPGRGDWCCDPAKRATPALYGVPVESDAGIDADDIAFRQDSAQFWTDARAVEHGPETARSVTVRVGRAVIIMEAISLDEHGNPVVSDEQFDVAISTAVGRARSQLADDPGP